MPLYDFKCQKCNHVEEYQLTVQTAGLVVFLCPECRGRMEKIISVPAVQFKGTGFPGNDMKKNLSKED
jgi:putative FmdB family regulatory protein